MSELKFTNHEVKERYCKALREAGITHISWAMGTIVSEDNIEEILATVKLASDFLAGAKARAEERED